MDNRTRQAIISVLRRRSDELEKGIYYAEYNDDNISAEKMKGALSECNSLLSCVENGDI